MPLNEKLLTRREVADALAVKEQTISKWAMTGKHLPVVRIGRTVRYRAADVQALMLSGSSTAAK
jgi:excisionase family DNA binding protein